MVTTNLSWSQAHIYPQVAKRLGSMLILRRMHLATRWRSSPPYLVPSGPSSLMRGVCGMDRVRVSKAYHALTNCSGLPELSVQPSGKDGSLRKWVAREQISKIFKNLQEQIPILWDLLVVIDTRWQCDLRRQSSILLTNIILFPNSKF